MVMIVLFLLVEIWPFFYVLDWDFMEIFVDPRLRSQASLIEPLLYEQMQSNISHMSLTSPRPNNYSGMTNTWEPMMKSGLTSRSNDNFWSDNFRQLNESASRLSRGERGGENQSMVNLPNDGLFINENEFSIYEQYKTSSTRKRGLGVLFRVRLNDDEKLGQQVLSRVIKFNRVKSYVIEEAFREIGTIKAMNNKHVLPTLGVSFNNKTNILQILMPQKISLHDYIHDSG